MLGELSETNSSDERPLEHPSGRKEARKSRKAREKRKKQIMSSMVMPGEMLGKYIIFGITHGCAARTGGMVSSDRQPNFIVWDAEDTDNEQDRVLKSANPKALLDTPELEAYIQNEWNVLRRLDHRNIVRAYKPIKKKHMTYLPMEYLPYGIHEVIGAKPDLEGIAFFASEAARAMQHLKREEVVHGDIKPSQFMAGHDPKDFSYSVVKLIDFGAAHHPETLPVGVTHTPAYAAPEVLSVVGSSQTDELTKILAFTHKSDMYSLGLTIARIALTSKMDHHDVSDVFTEPGKSAQRAREALYDHHLPYLLNRIIENMTEQDRNDRIDADEAIARINDLMFVFDLGPKMKVSKDLYSGKETGRWIERPY